MPVIFCIDQKDTMANKTICMLRLKQIFKLKSEGKSNRWIAKMLGIHRETVRSYVNEALRLGLSFSRMAEADEPELYEWFGKVEITRGSNKDKSEVLYALFPYIQKELGKTGVDRQVLYDEYKQANPDGYSYNHFCREYRLWCAAQNVSAILDHKAGDKVYVDFAGKKLEITDRQTGEVKKVDVFIGILGFSQFPCVEATPSQKIEAFITAVENMLHYMGGVPAAIICDNLKSAVLKPVSMNQNSMKLLNALLSIMVLPLFPPDHASQRIRRLLRVPLKLYIAGYMHCCVRRYSSV